MDSKSIRKQNMRLLINKVRGVKQFAEKVGTNADYVSSLLSEKGKRGPGDKIARQIEVAFGLQRGWMDLPLEAHYTVSKNEGGSDDLSNIQFIPADLHRTLTEIIPAAAQKQIKEDEESKILANDFVLVPKYEVKASMGRGQIVDSEQVVDHLAFKRNWVQVELGINPKNLALITAIGDSMEPTLRPGDLILLDRSVDQVKSDSVYVIAIDGELLAKRIQRKFDGSLVIKSDNKEYETQVLTQEQAANLRIIGRVVWAGRRM